MKGTILVVTTPQFNPYELWTSLKYLAKAEYGWEIAGIGTSVISDERGGRFDVSTDIELTDTTDLNPSPYIGMIFIAGGSDASDMWRSHACRNLVVKADMLDMPVGAICRATGVLAPISKGKTVSGFPLVEVRNMFKAAGANYVTRTLSVDGKLVTAEHQDKTEQWIQAFIDVMEGREVHLPEDSGFVPRGADRKPILKGKHYGRTW